MGVLCACVVKMAVRQNEIEFCNLKAIKSLVACQRTQCLQSHRMQMVLKYAVSGPTYWLLPTNLGVVSDKHWEYFHKKNIHAREVICGQIELQYVGWLLLDIGKESARGDMQM
jgi:hypothetical protein